jgi:hypothetical protein
VGRRYVGARDAAAERAQALGDGSPRRAERPRPACRDCRRDALPGARSAADRPIAAETVGLEVQAPSRSGRVPRLCTRPSRRLCLLTRACGGLGRPVRHIHRHGVEARPATAQLGGSVRLPSCLRTLDPDQGCHADHDHDASVVCGDVLDQAPLATLYAQRALPINGPATRGASERGRFASGLVLRGRVAGSHGVRRDHGPRGAWWLDEGAVASLKRSASRCMRAPSRRVRPHAHWDLGYA